MHREMKALMNSPLRNGASEREDETKSSYKTEHYMRNNVQELNPTDAGWQNEGISTFPVPMTWIPRITGMSNLKFAMSRGINNPGS